MIGCNRSQRYRRVTFDSLPAVRIHDYVIAAALSRCPTTSLLVGQAMIYGFRGGPPNSRDLLREAFNCLSHRESRFFSHTQSGPNASRIRPCRARGARSQTKRNYQISSCISLLNPTESASKQITTVLFFPVIRAALPQGCGLRWMVGWSQFRVLSSPVVLFGCTLSCLLSFHMPENRVERRRRRILSYGNYGAGDECIREDDTFGVYYDPAAHCALVVTADQQCHRVGHRHCDISSPMDVVLFGSWQVAVRK